MSVARTLERRPPAVNGFRHSEMSYSGPVEKEHLHGRSVPARADQDSPGELPACLIVYFR